MLKEISIGSFMDLIEDHPVRKIDLFMPIIDPNTVHLMTVDTHRAISMLWYYDPDTMIRANITQNHISISFKDQGVKNAS